ncbi:MAG: hypothetical protein HC893_09860 [Chloroflexaceae bacterium]|nr:hypothetical protein [Chloroflexaceae bacterium]NJL34101.1 hypothetical protein [Chloroflexaceae bacterium]NJO06549.1 hypothetical protein [Chloroflexaceae bacterium]
MYTHLRQFSRRQWLRLGSAVVVIVLAGLLFGLHTAQQSRAASAADVAVTLLPNPNIGVQPGSIVEYTIRVQNFGRGRADRVLINMPFQPQQVRVLDARFEGQRDWVSALGSDYISIFFEGLDGFNTARTATVRMLVRPDVPVGSVINMWAGYGWDGANGGGEGFSANAAPLVVLNENSSGPFAWMAVGPEAGIAGTVFTFYTNRLLPNEKAVIMMNTPFGVQEVARDVRVNELGELRYEFVSVGYPPGTYTLSMRGERSGITAAITFTVQ